MKLIPTPKKIDLKEGTFSLEGVQIAIMANCDNRIPKAALTLKAEIEAVTGKYVKTASAFSAPAKKAIYISYIEGTDESYTLTVCENAITVNGSSAAGAFYGIQTLRQLVSEYKNEIPCLAIEDTPGFKNRGFYHDITRGRVPTLDTMKKIVDTIASLKVNSMQIYIEDAFYFMEYEGVISKDCCMTAEEMTELDDYCYNNFIELVPSLSTFGHLFTLLQSEKYRHLCELEGFEAKGMYWLEKQHHHTIDAANPESIEVIKSMIDQFVPLFRSNKFNICCDETNDLCKGRNAGKDSGEMYFYFAKQIIEHVKSYGKEVQMWGDVVLAHMDIAKDYLDGVTVLNWNYTKVANEWIIKDIAAAGIPQIVCPGTTTWNRFVENLDTSVSNISGLARHGINHGAVGILNTNWGDFGTICPWNASLIGTAMGAQCGWNPGIEIDEDFKSAVSHLMYGTDANIFELVYNIGICENTCDWTHFMYWFAANKYDGRVTTLEVDEAATIENIEKINAIIPKLRKALPEGDALCDLTLACRGINIMNKVHLLINGTEGYQDREALDKEINEWFAEYKTAWLRDDKHSQIDVLGDFFKTLISKL